MSTTADYREVRHDRPSLTAPGVLLGVGLGGFVDGIVLHQILQWHQLLSTTDAFGEQTLANMQVNTMADGFFHLVTWLFVAVGVAVLWRTARAGLWRTSWRSLLGWMLVGWGAFNLIEGTINHHLLQIHRVRPDAGNPLAWDIGFLIFGAVLIAGGWLLQRGDEPARPAATATSTRRTSGSPPADDRP